MWSNHAPRRSNRDHGPPDPNAVFAFGQRIELRQPFMVCHRTIDFIKVQAVGTSCATGDVEVELQEWDVARSAWEKTVWFIPVRDLVQRGVAMACDRLHPLPFDAYALREAASSTARRDYVPPAFRPLIRERAAHSFSDPLAQLGYTTPFENIVAALGNLAMEGASIVDDRSQLSEAKRAMLLAKAKTAARAVDLSTPPYLDRSHVFWKHPSREEAPPLVLERLTHAVQQLISGEERLYRPVIKSTFESTFTTHSDEIVQSWVGADAPSRSDCVFAPTPPQGLQVWTVPQNADAKPFLQVHHHFDSCFSPSFRVLFSFLYRFSSLASLAFLSSLVFSRFSSHPIPHLSHRCEYRAVGRRVG
tara:strand:+ start:172 stop:1254 length:1083 start_codon:yes stop_codon:yes gene_type:complete